MTLLLLPYPDIKPEIFSIGPFAVRWYALAYIAGLVIGWQIMRRVCTQPPVAPIWEVERSWESMSRTRQFCASATVIVPSGSR